MKMKLSLLLAVLVLGSAQNFFGMKTLNPDGFNGGTSNQRHFLPFAFNEEQTLETIKTKKSDAITIPLAFGCVAIITKKLVSCTSSLKPTNNQNSSSGIETPTTHEIRMYGKFGAPVGISNSQYSSAKAQYANLCNLLQNNPDLFSLFQNSSNQQG